MNTICCTASTHSDEWQCLPCAACGERGRERERERKRERERERGGGGEGRGREGEREKKRESIYRYDCTQTNTCAQTSLVVEKRHRDDPVKHAANPRQATPTMVYLSATQTSGHGLDQSSFSVFSVATSRPFSVASLPELYMNENSNKASLPLSLPPSLPLPLPLSLPPSLPLPLSLLPYVSLSSPPSPPLPLSPLPLALKSENREGQSWQTSTQASQSKHTETH